MKRGSGWSKTSKFCHRNLWMPHQQNACVAIVFTSLIWCPHMSSLHHVPIHQVRKANLRENSGHQHPSYRVCQYAESIQKINLVSRVPMKIFLRLMQRLEQKQWVYSPCNYNFQHFLHINICIWYTLPQLCSHLNMANISYYFCKHATDQILRNHPSLK